MVLKQEAIKKHDQINALEFHKKEMDKHKASLKCFNIKDGLILWFESLVSDYGTNIIKAMAWMIFVSAFSLLCITYEFKELYGDGSFFKWWIYSLNPTLTLDKIIPECLYDSLSEYTKGIYYLLNILKAILIYEIIKSFRKYSRKL